MLVLVAVTLVILLVTLTFTVDIAFMQLSRTELRTAIDAAARAGAESLSRTQSKSAAIAAAIDIANDNVVASNGFTLPRQDVVLGRVTISNSSASVFRPDSDTPNAIRVDSGRTANRPDGSVRLFFGHLLGRGTFEPVQDAVAAQLDRDMALVLDHSGSMRSSGKFVGLSQAVSVFLQEIDKTPQTEHISMIGYSTTSRKRQELTPDTDLLRDAFSQLRPRGLTAIGLGLRDGIDSLKNDLQRRDFAEKTVVLMTDGQHNTDVIPETTALEAPPAGITIHTITFGSGADQARMKRVANIGRGKHFHAPNNSALISIFKEIASTLPVVLTE